MIDCLLRAALLSSMCQILIYTDMIFGYRPYGAFDASAQQVVCQNIKLLSFGRLCWIKTLDSLGKASCNDSSTLISYAPCILYVIG